MKECKSVHHIGDRRIDQSCFGRNKRYPDGLHYSCKNCVKISDKQRYDQTSEQIKQRVKIWQDQNKQRVNTTSQKYRQTNPERRKNTAEKWRKANLNHIRYLTNQRSSMPAS